MKKIIITSLVVALFMGSQAQLPTEFETKVSYFKNKTVTYEMKDSLSIACLNLLELSEYHGYEQEFFETHMVDIQGKIMFQSDVLYERNVRDDWMDKHSRYLIDQNKLAVYDENDQIIYSEPRSHDQDQSLTPMQAANFQKHVLDLNFYNALKDSMILEGFAIQEEAGVLSVATDSFNFVYDHNSKSFLFAIYEEDSMGGPPIKVQETARTFTLNPQNLTYAPESETTIEWFLSDSGCCIRKTIQIDYNGWTRTLSSGPIAKKENGEKNTVTPAYSLNSIADASAFMIKNESETSEKLKVSVYSIDGKLIAKKDVQTNQPIYLPKEGRSGMYLVHNYQEGSTTPVTGKIILTQEGTQF